MKVDEIKIKYNKTHINLDYIILLLLLLLVVKTPLFCLQSN